ncbi:hypothetical protein BDZ97DRAFT_1919318 [Flammula alnicola]|nr:hypothetical protein BDZ97DRAFT_1919318 [Flammula alnicola]
MDEHQRQKHEAILRRRAEQSARDKERHRQTVEQRAKTNAQTQADAEPAEYIPLTPVSTHTTRKNVPESPRTPFPSNRKTNLSPPLLVPQANTLSFSESFSIPMEDIQTCVVPDDLFKDERPVPPPRVAQTGPPVQASPTVTTGAERPSKPRSYRYPRRGQTGTTV